MDRKTWTCFTKSTSLVDLGLCPVRNSKEHKKPLDSGRPVQLHCSCALSGSLLLLHWWASSFSTLAWLGLPSPFLLYQRDSRDQQGQGGHLTSGRPGLQCGYRLWVMKPWANDSSSQPWFLACGKDIIPQLHQVVLRVNGLVGIKVLTQCLSHSKCWVHMCTALVCLHWMVKLCFCLVGWLVFFCFLF